jgi:hypothetical protein
MTPARDSRPPRETVDAVFETELSQACKRCGGDGWVYSKAHDGFGRKPCPACYARHTASLDARMVATGAIRPEAVERQEQAAKLWDVWADPDPAEPPATEPALSLIQNGRGQEWLAVRDAAAEMFAAPPPVLTREQCEQVREALAIFIHAHATGNNVPPHIEQDARAALALLSAVLNPEPAR